MDKRKEDLIKRMPKFLYFEERFKRDGKNIMGRKLNLSEPPKLGNFLNCSPLLNKEQEQILFRRLNYLKYRALSTTGRSSRRAEGIGLGVVSRCSVGDSTWRCARTSGTSRRSTNGRRPIGNSCSKTPRVSWSSA